MLSPFSWPGQRELEVAMREAGIGEVTAETKAMPMIFEGGVDQAFEAYSGQPVGPAIAGLPELVRERLREALAVQFSPMLRNGQIHGQMTSYLAIGSV
jgi:hypothetical protein